MRPVRPTRSVVVTPDFANDPFAYYAEWRKGGNVVQLENENVWLVLGYDAAMAALKDSQVFSSSPGRDVSPALHGADRPDHFRMRRLLQPSFAADRQNDRRSFVREIAQRKFQRLMQTRSFDLARDFTDPVALTVAAGWLGLDDTHAAALRERPVLGITVDEVESAMVSGGLMDELRSTGQFSRETLAELAGFFLLAGVKTARMFVLLALLELANHDFSLDGAVTPLVDELLRLQPPAHTLVRKTTQSTTLDGVLIPAQAIVWISVAAANRDETRFADPDAIVLDRIGSRHLSFAAGPHVCLGSHLGQVEAEEMVAVLLPHARKLVGSSPRPVISFSGPDGAPSLREIVSWPVAA